MYALTLAMYCFGALGAVAFLAIHRPRNWARAAAVNASGWVVVIALSFLRGVWLIVSHGAVAPPTSVLDGLISYGLLAAIDLLVWFRLITFLWYLHQRAGED